MLKSFLKQLLVVLLITGFCVSQADDYGRVRRIGDLGERGLPLAGLAYAMLMKDGDGMRQDVLAYAMTVITTDMLKSVVHEQRPNHTDFESFPSGHSSAAFSGAAFIHFRYGFKYAIPFYMAASFVACSRVYAQRHYFHDVVAGAALAIAFNRLLVSPHETNTYRLGFSPTVNHDGGMGVGMNLQIK